MTYLYGATDFTLKKRITDVYETMKSSEVSAIVKEFKNYMKNAFPYLFELNEILSERIKNKKGTSHALKFVNHTGSQKYCYFKKKELRIRHEIRGRSFKLNVKVPDEGKVNWLKIKRTLITGVFHSLDASIALNIRVELVSKGIPCYTVHDCFGVPLTHANVLKEIYSRELLRNCLSYSFQNSYPDLGLEKSSSFTL